YRAYQTPELLLAIVAAPHAKAVQRSKAARKLLEMQADEETRDTLDAIAASTANEWLVTSLKKTAAPEREKAAVE
ncbi:MAG: hypothetical protein ABI461_23340, partial [Polyangiaceae bacterium]